MMKCFTLFLMLCSASALVASSIPKEELCLWKEYGDKEKMIEKAVFDEVTNYQNLLKKISNKKLSEASRNAAIESAKKFFESGAMIEVSSLNKKGTRFYVFDEYLTHLKNLNYHLVKIVFDPQTVSIVDEKGKNHYVLIANCRQHFRGEDKNGKPVYEDFTIKNIEIDVKFDYDDTHEKITNIQFKKITVEKTLPEAP